MNEDLENRYEAHRRAVARGHEAAQALQGCEPYLQKVRLALMEEWTREPDPARREILHHHVRGVDLTLKTIKAEIETGRSAAQELAHLAELGKFK